MRHPIARWATAAALVVACIVVAAVAAYAEMPAAQAPDTGGVAHHWVAEQAGWAPYTETTGVERVAKTQAVKALGVPDLALIAQADHGYASAQRLVLLARSLKGRDPAIIGHEILVFNSDTAARLYVGAGGDVRLLEVGPTQRMLVTRAMAAADGGDKDAVEVGEQAVKAGSALADRKFPIEGALVSAHAVGFTDADGSHIVVRVEPDGATSYPDW